MRVPTYCVTAAPGAAQTLRRGFACVSSGPITRMSILISSVAITIWHLYPNVPRDQSAFTIDNLVTTIYQVNASSDHLICLDYYHHPPPHRPASINI